MTFATNLLQALILAAVASGLYSLITANWAWRQFVGLWVALTLIAYVAVSGPLIVG